MASRDHIGCAWPVGVCVAHGVWDHMGCAWPVGIA